jgi:hypothetical protein
MAEALRIEFSQPRVFFHQMQPEYQEVIEIKQILFLFFLCIMGLNYPHLRQVLDKIRVALLDKFVNAHPGIV